MRCRSMISLLVGVACTTGGDTAPTGSPAGPVVVDRADSTTALGSADTGPSTAPSTAPWVTTTAPTPCTPTDTVGFTAERLPHPAQPEHRFAGGGIAVLDADDDGALDLLAASDDGVRLLLGPTFAEEAPLPEVHGPVTGVAAADLDDDGDPDVVLTRHGPADVFLRNDDGSFVVVDTGHDAEGHSQSTAIADVTGDGRLDVLIAGHGIPEVEGDQVVIDAPGSPTRLLVGTDTPFHFTDRTDELPADFLDAYSFVVAPVHLAGDDRVDLYTANDYPNWLPQQAAVAEGEGWVGADPSLGLSANGAGMGLGIGDINDDGVDDLLLPIWNRIIMLTSLPGVGWVDTAPRDGLVLPPRPGPWVGWGGELADLDNDGELDVLVAFGHLDTLAERTVGGGSAANIDDQPMVAWLRRGDGFERVQAGLPVDGAHRGFALADLDGDGSLDVAAPRLDGGIDLLRGACPAHAWLTVAAEQPGPNRQAIGARLTVRTATHTVRRTLRAGGTSLLSSAPPVAHLGLGDAQTADVEITWPDGEVTLFEDLPTRQHLVVHRPDPRR